MTRRHRTVSAVKIVVSECTSRQKGAYSLLFLSFISLMMFAVSRTLSNTRLERQESFNHAYRGRDHPRIWPLPPLAPVELTRSHSIHYDLTSTAGLAEWNASLPSGGAVVHLGPDHRPFTVSILHQLRCLDIIRASLVDFYTDDAPDATFGNAALAKHCMHYLRQMVLCRVDTRLESVRAPKGKGLTVWEVTHECLDWTAVFDAAEENWRLYMSTTS